MGGAFAPVVVERLSKGEKIVSFSLPAIHVFPALFLTFGAFQESFPAFQESFSSSTVTITSLLNTATIYFFDSTDLRFFWDSRIGSYFCLRGKKSLSLQIPKHCPYKNPHDLLLWGLKIIRIIYTWQNSDDFFYISGEWDLEESGIYLPSFWSGRAVITWHSITVLYCPCSRPKFHIIFNDHLFHTGHLCFKPTTFELRRKIWIYGWSSQLYTQLEQLWN